jgi:hypothetical protein
MLIMAFYLQFTQKIDDFIVFNELSPYALFLLGVVLCSLYPKLTRWNPGRRDATGIMATSIGLLIGTHLNSKHLYEPTVPQPFSLVRYNLSFMLQRSLIGLAVLLAIRTVLKIFLLRSLCFVTGLDRRDPQSKQAKVVEVPYYFLTYIPIGLSITFISPTIFRHLDIEKLFY